MIPLVLIVHLWGHLHNLNLSKHNPRLYSVVLWNKYKAVVHISCLKTDIHTMLHIHFIEGKHKIQVFILFLWKMQVLSGRVLSTLAEQMINPNDVCGAVQLLQMSSDCELKPGLVCVWRFYGLIKLMLGIWHSEPFSMESFISFKKKEMILVLMCL